MTRDEIRSLTPKQKSALIDGGAGQHEWPWTIVLGRGKSVTLASFDEWWEARRIAIQEGSAEHLRKKGPRKGRTEGQKHYIAMARKMGWI